MCSFLGWEDLDVVNPEDGKAEKAIGSEQANEGLNQEVRTNVHLWQPSHTDKHAPTPSSCHPHYSIEHKNRC